MKLKNLVLISILILSLFLVACSSNGTFAGKAVATASNCIDSDGMNYTNNGRVIINANNRNTTYTDACSGNQLLYERYCNGVSLATAQIYCDQTFGSQYTCYAGRCIISQSSCTDTDGGRNYNQKGTMTIRTPLGQTSTNSDYCQNSTQLFEHYCINGVSGSRGGYNCYNLGENYTCSNGACVGPTVNFCYYIDANGTQMPAGWRWRDFPYSDYGLKNYTGTRTNYGDTGFSCVNSDNIGILYVPTCGISPYYTSGNVQQGMNISFSYCGFGCNPTTNRCCMKIGNATQFCDGNMIVNITNTDCGVKEYRINCANEVDFYTGRPKVCDIDSCMSSCTPGEQITTCRYNYGRYTCNAQGNYYIYNSGASSCPTGTACNGYMCVNNQTNSTGY